jgi:hypothetical protein
MLTHFIMFRLNRIIGTMCVYFIILLRSNKRITGTLVTRNNIHLDTSLLVNIHFEF